MYCTVLFILQFFFDEVVPSLCCRFSADLSYSQVSVSPNTEIQLGEVTDRLYSPTTCSAILVGGEYTSDLQNLLERIGRLAEDMAKPPQAILLFVDEFLDVTNILHSIASHIVRHIRGGVGFEDLCHFV